MIIENSLLDVSDAVAEGDEGRAHQTVADIATDESEQEFGVVINAIMADYFGFGYQKLTNGNF